MNGVEFKYEAMVPCTDVSVAIMGIFQRVGNLIFKHKNFYRYVDLIIIVEVGGEKI